MSFLIAIALIVLLPLPYLFVSGVSELLTKLIEGIMRRRKKEKP